MITEAQHTEPNHNMYVLPVCTTSTNQAQHTEPNHNNICNTACKLKHVHLKYHAKRGIFH